MLTTFKEIDEARKLFGLGEYARLAEIIKTYRKLSLQYHPDKCSDNKKKECEKMFKKINHANNILKNYCTNYKFSFKKEDVKKNIDDRELYESEHYEQFYSDWY